MAAGPGGAGINLSKAIDLDGVNDDLGLGDKSIWSFNGTTDAAFTLDVWLRTRASGTNGGPIFTKYAAGQKEYTFGFSAGRPYVFFDDPSAAAYIGRSYATALTADTVYHLAMVYNGNGASTGIDIYLDGTVVDNTNQGGGVYVAMENGTSVLSIGKTDGGLGGPLKAKIRRARIWNTNLSSGNITTLAAAAANHIAAGCILDVGVNGAGTIQDFSTLANTVTVNGATVVSWA